MKRFVFISWAVASAALGAGLAAIIVNESATMGVPTFVFLALMYPIVIFICGWLLAMKMASLKEMAKEKGLRSFALDCIKEKIRMEALFMKRLFPKLFLAISCISIALIIGLNADRIANYLKEGCEKSCGGAVGYQIGKLLRKVH